MSNLSTKYLILFQLSQIFEDFVRAENKKREREKKKEREDLNLNYFSSDRFLA